MKITELAVTRNTTVLVLLGLILCIGIYSYIMIPRESSPEVVIPYIFVTVRYEGVSPEDMESLVTIPIERKLTGLSGVKKIESTSNEGMSSISIEFQPDVEIEDALQRVRDKVDQAKQDIPADADDPSIFEVNFSESPIMIMCLTGNYPLAVLNEIAEDIEDRLESIPGVLDVAIIGGVEREIQIEVDPERVAAYGVSFADLINVVSMENVNTPGGSLDLGEGKYLMRTPGEFRTPEELENLVVKVGEQGAVYLRDLAVVRDGFKDTTTISRVNDKPAVTLALSKRSGTNIIRLADEVNRTLDNIRRRLPTGIDISLTWDESVWIRDMVSELENNILSGMILVLVVIFVSLGFYNALMVSLAIPVSMLITFAFLYFSGVTLNMVCLFSLILAVGMLVDNGIVVVENIYRHIQQGMTPVEAAKLGTHEVSMPIIGSTLTTVVAFLPMFFWPGIWGEFMVYLPATVCISLSASLFVALVINPSLAALFLKPRKEIKRSKHYLTRSYERILRFSLKYPAITLTSAFTALVCVVTIFGFLGKTEFLPEIEPPQARINVKCPEGTNLETSDQTVRMIEDIVRPYRQHIEHVITSVGSQSGGGGEIVSGGGGNTSHLSRVTLDFPKLSGMEIPPSEILEKIRPELEKIVGAEVRIDKMGMGPPSGPPINIELSGDDYKVLAQLAQEVKSKIASVPNLVDLRDDYNAGKPEVRVIVDRVQAWKTGLSTRLIGEIVKAAINGREAAEFREGDKEYDVTVRFPKHFREDLTNLKNMKLINIAGSPVPFSAVAEIEQGAGLGSIKRINRKRTVTVSAEVEGERRPPEVLKEVQAIVSEQVNIPGGYTVAYTGENQENEETQAFLMKAFLLAVLLVAFVLIAQFNSIVQCLIIMTTVVLSLVGVFLGYLICGMPFGVLMSGIGCISLAGVVVNNGIVLLEFINELRTKEPSVFYAVIHAGTIRLRPVLLTAVTTVIGLIPMAAGISFDFRNLTWSVGGESSQWWGPMAIAVIFGLSFATILTLIVVPTLYYVTSGISSFFAKKKEKQLVPVIPVTQSSK